MAKISIPEKASIGARKLATALPRFNNYVLVKNLEDKNKLVINDKFGYLTGKAPLARFNFFGDDGNPETEYSVSLIHKYYDPEHMRRVGEFRREVLDSLRIGYGFEVVRPDEMELFEDLENSDKEIIDFDFFEKLENVRKL